MNTKAIQLDDLLGIVPDPISDAALLHRARANAHDLAQTLLARQDLWARPLGDLLPGLEACPDPQPIDRDLGRRAQNLLGRSRWTTWGGLADASPLRLWGLPNLGTKSFVEIVQMVLTAWVDHHAARDPTTAVSAFTQRVSVALSDDTPGADVQSPHPLHLVTDELQGVLLWAWAEAGATTVENALSALAMQRLPPDVAATRTSLLAADLGALLGRHAPDEASWQRVLSLGEREHAIAAGRIFFTGPGRPTLDQLSSRFGVTRERIRQVESAVKEQLTDRLASEEGADIRHLAARLRAGVGAIADAEHLRNLASALVAESSDAIDSSEAAFRSAVLVATSGAYSQRSGLVLAPTAAEEVARVERALASHPAEITIEPSQLEEVLALTAGAPRLTDRVLDSLGVRSMDGRFVVWAGTQGDKAVAVLAARGDTMSMTEIHEAVGFHVNPRSLAGRVQSEPRIMRRGKDLYGLRAWGGEEYTGILDELEQAIERAGGSADLEQLVEMFVTQFGVTSMSVRSYAAGRRFVRTADGRVAMRGADDPEPAMRHHPVHAAPGAFLLGGMWHYRVEIDHDFLRGSGRPIRQAIALELGLEPDLTIGFAYDGVTVVFAWGASQPTIGSIRGLVRAHGCAEGDLVFLPLSGKEPRRARVARGVDLRREHGVRRLAVAIGLDADEADEAEHPLAVAEAFGLPPGADWIDITDRIRDRGDRGLLELVPERYR